MNTADNSGIVEIPLAAGLICFDVYEMDTKTAELRKAGEHVTLHEQAFQILLVLLQARGGLVTKDDLQKTLWPSGTEVDWDRSINKAMAKLRMALGDSTEAPRFIETVRDHGYRFLAEVRFPDEAAFGDSECDSAIVQNDAVGLSADRDQIAAFGAYEVDLGTPELRKRGLLIRVHPQSLKLLLLLLKHQGQLLSKEELQSLLWPSGTHVDFESSLKKAVSNLRIALNDSAEKPSFIETLSGRGYRFIAPVRYRSKSSGNGTQSALDVDGAEVACEVGSEHKPANTSPNNRRNLPVAYAIAAIVLILLSSTITLYVHWRSAHSNAVRPSIAVLEFRNLSGQPEEGWLATALSEWIVAELSSGGQLRIIPGDQITQMQMELPTIKSAPPTPDGLLQIRRILGTDFVVSGSYGVLEEGGNQKIKIDLQLQDTRTGKVIKTISETENKADLFSLVSRTGESLRLRLGVHKASREELQSATAGLPSSAEAMRLYSEGLHKLRMGDALTACDLLQKAALAEPNDANIHDRLATAWAALGYDFKAREESQKALSLATNLSREEHLLIEGRSEAFATNWNRAVEIYHTLFDFFPDNPEYGLALADAQGNIGKTKDAMATITSLKQLASLRDDPRIDLAEASILLAMGDAKQALAVDERAEKKAADAGASVQVADAEFGEGWAYLHLSAVDKAVERLTDARTRFAAAGMDMRAAEALQLRSTAYNYAADFKRAESSYEEALSISRRIGYQNGVADDLLSIGDIRSNEGDTAGAKMRFDEALSLFQELHSDSGVAMAKHCLGTAFIRMGMPLEAQKMYQESLEIFQKSGTQHWIAENLLYLAEASRYQGDFDAALTELEQGVKIDKKMDNKTLAGWSEVLRAQILLDQNRNEEAVSVAQNSATVLGTIKDAAGEEYGRAMLAQAYLQQGKLSEAQKNIREARAVWEKANDTDSGLAISLNEALIQAASGNKNDRVEAEKKLRNLINDATRIGYMSVAFEVRFELDKMEFENSRTDSAREQLRTLAREANGKGMGLISWKIGKLLKDKPLAVH